MISGFFVYMNIYLSPLFILGSIYNINLMLVGKRLRMNSVLYREEIQLVKAGLELGSSDLHVQRSAAWPRCLSISHHLRINIGVNDKLIAYLPSTFDSCLALFLEFSSRLYVRYKQGHLHLALYLYVWKHLLAHGQTSHAG